MKPVGRDVWPQLIHGCVRSLYVPDICKRREAVIALGYPQVVTTVPSGDITTTKDKDQFVGSQPRYLEPAAKHVQLRDGRPLWPGSLSRISLGNHEHASSVHLYRVVHAQIVRRDPRAQQMPRRRVEWARHFLGHRERSLRLSTRRLEDPPVIEVRGSEPREIQRQPVVGQERAPLLRVIKVCLRYRYRPRPLNHFRSTRHLRTRVKQATQRQCRRPIAQLLHFYLSLRNRTQIACQGARCPLVTSTVDLRRIFSLLVRFDSTTPRLHVNTKRQRVKRGPGLLGRRQNDKPRGVPCQVSSRG